MIKSWFEKNISFMVYECVLFKLGVCCSQYRHVLFLFVLTFKQIKPYVKTSEVNLAKYLRIAEEILIMQDLEFLIDITVWC